MSKVVQPESETRPARSYEEDPLEIWGGVEATVNRVGDRYLDQLARSGHEHRHQDLELFADLGIKAIRYPILWERIAADGLHRANWNWPDLRLNRLRTLGLRPIVGLVHHGSGPRDTSLLDPEFPKRLAGYAAAVARRYPWVSDYTPINEPLTTARFSALYGHWYPHERSDLSFARAFLIQCRAVVLAMQAIRQINPDARLVQTEEVSRSHSTPALAYQARFENERRWLTYDVLCGLLTDDRPMWSWLLDVGIRPDELEWFQENTCPPDLLGVNYYLSGERFLDERVDMYPGEPVGGNGIHEYVDVLAARVLSGGIGGVGQLLREAWDRYHRPLCITEVHNGAEREEQLRWLHEVWHDARQARSEGVDVRAATVWALLGSYDWPTLVTKDEGVYEPGVFDVRGPRPRPTALAHMIRQLATTGDHYHPVLDTRGWWRRADRFTYGHTVPHAVGPSDLDAAPDNRSGAGTVLIITQESGLAHGLEAALIRRSVPVQVLETATADEVHRTIEQGNVWAAILAGCTVNPSSDFQRLSDGYAVGTTCAEEIAQVCARANVSFVTFSACGDRIGSSGRDRSESAPSPFATRAEVDLTRTEQRFLDQFPTGLILRTDGQLANADFAATACDSPVGSSMPMLEQSRYLDSISVLADAVIDLLLDGEVGVWRFSGQEHTSFEEFHRASDDTGGVPLPVLEKPAPC